MGYCVIFDPLSGKTTFLGESPVELKPELPADDPLHELRAAANRSKLTRYLKENGDIPND